MKISQRLRQIDKMISQRYDHIWDCCCDHGLLGASLLARQAGGIIHFVDQVQPLMAEVHAKLTHFYPGQESIDSPGDSVNILSDSKLADSSRWRVHCQDVAKLPLADEACSQLIIIAGVGGELMVELLSAILTSYPNHNLEFMLCPVHHVYQVRKSLADMGLGLVDERLMQERQRFYEILHVSSRSTEAIPPVGASMWDLSRPLDRAYLSRTLAHYRRMLKSQRPACEADDIRRIIQAYDTVAARL